MDMNSSLDILEEDGRVSKKKKIQLEYFLDYIKYIG